MFTEQILIVTRLNSSAFSSRCCMGVSAYAQVARTVIHTERGRHNLHGYTQREEGYTQREEGIICSHTCTETSLYSASLCTQTMCHQRRWLEPYTLTIYGRKVCESFPAYDTVHTPRF